jgi:hypothetical protein
VGSPASSPPHRRASTPHICGSLCSHRSAHKSVLASLRSVSGIGTPSTGFMTAVRFGVRFAHRSFAIAVLHPPPQPDTAASERGGAGEVASLRAGLRRALTVYPCKSVLLNGFPLNGTTIKVRTGIRFTVKADVVRGGNSLRLPARNSQRWAFISAMPSS